MFGYSLNYLIDTKEAVIVDVEATPTRISKEVEATETRVERTAERLDLKPSRMAGDVAYGTGKLLGWLIGHKIVPHIEVWDRSKREDGTFSREDFSFDHDANVYVCPGGKILKTPGKVHDGNTLHYRASKLDREVCPLKPKCCPKAPARKIPRDVNEAARDDARSAHADRGLIQQSAREGYENRRAVRRRQATYPRPGSGYAACPEPRSNSCWPRPCKTSSA